MKGKYKRTKADSPLRCPYCGQQFTMNGRRLAYYLDNNPLHKTKCKSCNNEFYFTDVSAKYAREHNIPQATWKVGEDGNPIIL